jgi:hypothetical protein
MEGVVPQHADGEAQVLPPGFHGSLLCASTPVRRPAVPGFYFNRASALRTIDVSVSSSFG